jgi:ABC-type uncharacterized transport system YnjBCD substrate-binding protein
LPAEGGLVLHTALVGAPSTKAIAKAFEAKYRIPVQLLEARASEWRERMRTEQSAGRHLGDVMFNCPTVMFSAVSMAFAVLSTACFLANTQEHSE